MICQNCKKLLLYFVDYYPAPLCNSINLEIGKLWKELTKNIDKTVIGMYY